MQSLPSRYARSLLLIQWNKFGSVRNILQFTLYLTAYQKSTEAKERYGHPHLDILHRKMDAMKYSLCMYNDDIRSLLHGDVSSLKLANLSASIHVSQHTLNREDVR